MRFSRAYLAFGLSVCLASGATGAEPPSADAAASASQAAAKHAKLTACLKDAKAKKLLGADKTAFIKHCMEGS